MLIAIDSAKKMRYSGVVSGYQTEVEEFYSELKKIFKSHGIRDPLHWSKISNKNKDVCKNDIISLVNNSKINFNIFFHPKPKDVTRKEYYICHVPNSISENLEHWLRNKGGRVKIVVDNDYNFQSGKTEDFINNFLKQITFRLVGKQVKIRKEKGFRATIKFTNSKILDFYAIKSDINNSKEIQLIDIILGCYLTYDKCFDEKRIFFRKI